MTENLVTMIKKRRRVLWDRVGTRRMMTRRRVTKIITTAMIEGTETVIEAIEIDAGTGIEIEIVGILEMTDRKTGIGTIDPIITKKKIAQDLDLDQETELRRLLER